MLLLRLVDLRELGAVLARSQLGYLLPVLLLRPAIYVVRGLRVWQVMSLGAEAKLPLLPTVAWYFVSLSAGVFTPVGIGELSMTYFMRRYDIEVAQGIAALMLDKAITSSVVAVIATGGAIFYLDADPRWWLALAAGGSLLLLAVLVARHNERHFVRLPAPFGAPASSALRLVMRYIWRRPTALLANLAAALLQSLLFAVQIWLCFRMLGSPVALAGVFWLSGIGRLAILVPITIGGLGVYEGSMSFLLTELGPSLELCLAAVLVPRLVTWSFAAFVLSAFVWKRRQVVP